MSDFETGAKVRVLRGHHKNRRGVIAWVRGDLPSDEVDFVPLVAFVNLRIGEQVHGVEFMVKDLAVVALEVGS